jgi:hypothetical protein
LQKKKKDGKKHHFHFAPFHCLKKSNNKLALTNMLESLVRVTRRGNLDSSNWHKMNDLIFCSLFPPFYLKNFFPLLRNQKPKCTTL